MENSSQAVEIISKLLTPITETCILKKNELIAYYIYVCVCVSACVLQFFISCNLRCNDICCLLLPPF